MRFYKQSLSNVQAKEYLRHICFLFYLLNAMIHEITDIYLYRLQVRECCVGSHDSNHSRCRINSAFLPIYVFKSGKDFGVGLKPPNHPMKDRVDDGKWT